MNASSQPVPPQPVPPQPAPSQPAPPLPDFAQIFQEIHKVAPYPWQARLATRVVETGRWPAAIGVPTGAGKTAALDVALYALAAEADRPPEARRAPRRIVLVVDRRTVVDQAWDRARVIAQALSDAPAHSAVGALAARLRALCGDPRPTEPLQIGLLRGGVPRDDGWARRPDQPLIAISTVDQVGSRLLFRGYGVRPTLQSVHAGLLGHDTLFLLDEVHLARPFQETLAALADRWRRWRQVALPDRWQVVALSATAGDATAFALDDADRATPALARRLAAPKALRLLQAGSATHGRDRRPHPRWLKALAAPVTDAVAAGARCVGVVVNRVDTASALAELLRPHHDVLLITGRMRGADRAAVAARLQDRAGPGWSERHAAADPLVVVATQAIEAGADLDFDALVTEIAPLDALVQRLGRLNRTGAHPAAHAAVIAPADLARADDLLYGAAPAHTWDWLSAQSLTDVGPAALTPRLAQAPAECVVPRQPAAVLVPPHLDLLAQTGPVPHPDPDPALYLHGLTPPRPEVHIVWRADVALADPDQATARLQAVPPTAFEAVPLPIATARRWLAREPVGPFADLGGEPDAEPGRSDATAPVALRWDGREARPVTVRQVAPGQTLVVPAAHGGLSLGTFTGAAGTPPVPDAGDLGRTLQSGRVLVRLDLAVHGQRPGEDPGGPLRWPAPIGAAAPTPPPVPDGHTTAPAAARRAVLAWLRALDLPAAAADEAPLLTLLRLLQLTGATAQPVAGAWILRGVRPLTPGATLALARGQSDPPADDPITADGGSVVGAAPVALAEHLDHVAAWAHGFARALGLPAPLADDLARAARWHDLGKADRRFQALLHGGDPIRAAGGHLLAKSGPELADAGARRRARERAGLPRGFRHELASVALLQGEPGQALLAQAHDPDLVLHLVAAHHGHARPLAPIEGPAPSPAPAVAITVDGCPLQAPGDHGLDRLDSGVSARFFRVQQRYGWWGLAWLEAILRLADHRASEAEQQASEADQQASEPESETRQPPGGPHV